MFPLRCSTLRSVSRVTPSLFPRLFSTAASTSSTSTSFNVHRTAPSGHGWVLVYGGNGALGKGMIETFKKDGWNTICVDYALNGRSDVSILLDHSVSFQENTKLVDRQLTELASSLSHLQHKHQSHKAHADSAATSSPPSSQLLASVIHCAGSWMGGDVRSTTPHFLESMEKMIQINLFSATSAAWIAGRHLVGAGITTLTEKEKKNHSPSNNTTTLSPGLLVLTGANAALHNQPCPTMIGYGASKAALHHLVHSLKHKEAGLFPAKVACLLPSMIDTQSNRSMSGPGADYSNWTPTSHFAHQVLHWVKNNVHQNTGKMETVEGLVQVQPLKNGGFYSFKTQKHQTTVELVE